MAQPRRRGGEIQTATMACLGRLMRKGSLTSTRWLFPRPQGHHCALWRTWVAMCFPCSGSSALPRPLLMALNSTTAPCCRADEFCRSRRMLICKGRGALPTSRLLSIGLHPCRSRKRVDGHSRRSCYPRLDRARAYSTSPSTQSRRRPLALRWLRLGRLDPTSATTDLAERCKPSRYCPVRKQLSPSKHGQRHRLFGRTRVQFSTPPI